MFRGGADRVGSTSMAAVQGGVVRERDARTAGERMPDGGDALGGNTGIVGVQHAVRRIAFATIQEADECWHKTLVLLRGGVVIPVLAILDELLA
jgi:hypothetical protein